MKNNIDFIIKIFLYLVYFYFCFLMIKISLQYISLDIDIAFLRIKQDVININNYTLSFFVHAFSTLFTLLFGITQFSKYILKTFPKFHRIFGRLYVFFILFLAGPSGLFLSFYANGGNYSKIGFISLSILWIFFTFLAYKFAINRDISNHRNYMIRSFSLTLSAISLRFWKVIIVFFFHPKPMDLYQIISWLGWTLNLLIAEVIILKFKWRRK